MRTQEKMQTMIAKSKEAIFAKMAELAEFIHEIGSRVTKISINDSQDLPMSPDTNYKTPQKENRPEFDSTGKRSKKTRVTPENQQSPQRQNELGDLQQYEQITPTEDKSNNIHLSHQQESLEHANTQGTHYQTPHTNS